MVAIVAIDATEWWVHCKPGEAYTQLIIASCEAGPGTTHMWIMEIYVWSLQTLEIAARCVFHNSIIGLSKCHLYIEGSNHHPFNILLSISLSKVFLAGIELPIFKSCGSSLHHYTMVFSAITAKMS
jgi:hypothetical protein